MSIHETRRQSLLNTVQEKYGFVPNVLKELSRNPAVLDAYLKAGDALAESSLTEPEKQIVMLTVSRSNGCNYCQAVHRALSRGAAVAPETLNAIASDQPPPAPRDRVLVEATRQVVEKRGWLKKEDLENLAEQGLTREELYEIIAIVGIKTISNYINHIAGTSVDLQFQG